MSSPMVCDDEFHASLRVLRLAYQKDLESFRDTSLDSAIEDCIRKDSRSKGWDRLMRGEPPMIAETSSQAQYETFVPFILMKLSYMINGKPVPSPNITSSRLSVSLWDNPPVSCYD
jgi:hypothetical protein